MSENEQKEPSFNYYFDNIQPIRILVEDPDTGDESLVVINVRPYTMTTLANPKNFPPLNAVRVSPPETIEGYWPAWDPQTENWVHIPDHRGETGYIGGVSHTIKTLGHYPEGWSTSPPPPSAEQLKAQRLAEIQSELDILDAKSIRTIRAKVTLEEKILNIAIRSEPDELEEAQAALDQEIAILNGYQESSEQLRLERRQLVS
jgi:hypothetical protein